MGLPVLDVSCMNPCRAGGKGCLFLLCEREYVVAGADVRLSFHLVTVCCLPLFLHLLLLLHCRPARRAFSSFHARKSTCAMGRPRTRMHVLGR